MNTNKVWIAVVVVAIIAVGGYFTGGKSIVQNTLGATPTLDGVDNSYVKINGVEEAYVSQAINATSTMLCNIKNPYTASSTLSSFRMRITSGILGNNNYSISTSSASYGSSTPVLVLDHTIPTLSTDRVAWFPTGATTTNRVLPGINSTTGETNVLLRAGEFVVVRLATTTGAGALTSYYGGQCSAVFQRI